ncbi:MAG: zf-HC2 domain-containing protein [Gemmatimonadaceae bacterium]
MLPDLLHGALGASDRARVESHLGVCESCRQELEVIRTVKSAALFEPTIDAAGIARQIPPYARIAPSIEAPARSRTMSWLVAASLAVVIAGGGSLLLGRQNSQVVGNRVAVTQSATERSLPVASPQESVQATVAASNTGSTSTGQIHVLALAAGVDGLSDGDLRQLMRDMDQFDALPATEPDPVIAVDSGDDLSQDLR